MKPVLRSIIPALLAVAPLSAVAQGPKPSKKPLDHSVYDSWRSVRGTTLTEDGRYVAYVIAPQEGDAVTEIRATGSEKIVRLERGSNVQFSRDGKYAIVTVAPAFAETRKARRAKAKPEDMPKGDVVIVNLESGEQTKLERVTSVNVPREDSGWIVYRPEPPKAEPPKAGQPAEKPAGVTYVVRQLGSGKEERIENVGDLVVSKDGTVVAYTVTPKDEKAHGVVLFDLTKGTKKTVVAAKGKYSKLAISDATKAIAFATDKDEPRPEKEDPKNPKKYPLSVYLFSPADQSLTLVAKPGTAGMRSDWWVSENGAVRFSEKGGRLFFPTAPRVEEKKDETPDDEKVSVDVWNWKDPSIQPAQLLGAAAEQRRTYDAVYHLGSKKIVQLETPEMPNVTVSVKGDGDLGIGSSSLPYRQLVSWDTGYTDYFLVDVNTGQPKRVVEKLDGFLTVSPQGKHVLGYDQPAKTYFAIDPATGTRRNLTLPTPVFNELEDTPGAPSPYGTSEWLPNDSAVIVYDSFDAWALDPSGTTAPRNLTKGYGRNWGVRLRVVDLDGETEYQDPSKGLLLSAADQNTRATGFYSLPANGSPTKIVMEDKQFGGLAKAKKGDVITYTRGSFVEYPDVWLAKSDFTGAQKVTNANPQQAQYNWGTAELVTWTSNEGEKLQGILYKPEDFDYGKTYPMITYFYERSADTLHGYRSPAPSASTVNIPYFVSNGYLIFVPDIPYKTGYPGESAMSAIMPGVQSILGRGYVDPKRLGIQGQSWGGYQVAYMVTETNMFAAACSGAAVSNMFSAYGGIRYGTGLVRQMQYEKGQSRIDGTPWDKPLRYLENSPLFFLDKVKTPLLMMHNDKDGAVPFTQGVELFAGLRRLGKPSWMVVYNGEDHNLIERKNRKDWSVRMAQFFDHYLKGAPAPVWMTEGVPATQKGKTYGFETPKQ